MNVDHQKFEKFQRVNRAIHLGGARSQKESPMGIQNTTEIILINKLDQEREIP